MATIKTVRKRVEDMVIRDGVAMKCAFGENPKRVYRDKKDAGESGPHCQRHIFLCQLLCDQMALRHMLQRNAHLKFPVPLRCLPW